MSRNICLTVFLSLTLSNVAISQTTTAQVQPSSCADSIRDRANPNNCIHASSVPTQGMLLPLGRFLFVDMSGRVGIGTTSPTEKLDVLGSIKMNGAGSGVVFPDGSKQTTAVAGGGGGVPSGFSILGNTATPPPGYTFTGQISQGNFWILRPQLPLPREGLCAVAWGAKIYALGGNTAFSGPSGIVPYVHAYDATTGLWSQIDTMQTARTKFGAAVLDGVMYAIGGLDQNSNPLTSVEAINLLGGGWTNKAPLLNFRAHFATAVVNKKLYIMGGQTPEAFPSASVEEYDPETDTWTPKASMLFPRYSFGAAVVNGKIYVVDRDGPVEEYDPENDTWTEKAFPLTPRGGLGVTAVNGKILAIGGGTYITEEYDPGTNSWSPRASMSFARLGQAVAQVNGKVIVVGGYITGSTQPPTLIPQVEEYLPGVSYFVHTKN